jgi:hypothetical protein
MKWRIAMIGLIAIATIYMGEDVSVRYRIPRSREPLGKVTVRRYGAIPQKAGKTEFIYEEPLVETCVHALFPHMGFAPCWYLQRQGEQRVNY